MEPIIDKWETRLITLLPVWRAVPAGPYESIEQVLDLLDCSPPITLRYDWVAGFDLLFGRASRNGEVKWSRQLTRHAGNAWTSPRTRQWEIKLSAVMLRMRHDAHWRFTVLAHEIGHCYMQHAGWRGRDRSEGLSRSRIEYEAELFAYCVALALGLEGAHEFTLAQLTSGYHGKFKPDLFGIDLALLRANAFLFVRNATKGVR